MMNMGLIWFTLIVRKDYERINPFGDGTVAVNFLWYYRRKPNRGMEGLTITLMEKLCGYMQSPMFNPSKAK
ncbi:hypothetical protein CS542_08590 [Pedobacter sp. IW39]|nr:hypothetical protein CS542_08590 [Pedobacter sp. IW39]